MASILSINGAYRPSGECTVEDLAKPGEVLTLKKHDVFRADKGTKAKWTSVNGAKCAFSFLPRVVKSLLIILVLQHSM